MAISNQRMNLHSTFNPLQDKIFKSESQLTTRLMQLPVTVRIDPEIVLLRVQKLYYAPPSDLNVTPNAWVSR